MNHSKVPGHDTMDQPAVQLGTPEARATIALHGGGIAAYRLTGEPKDFDLLHPMDRGAGTAAGALSAASFPLIPYSNRIRDGRLRFAGKTYRLPLNFGDHPHSIHGVTWQQPWRLVRRSDRSAEIEFTNDESQWPFPFRATQIFSLDGRNLRNEIALTNTGDAAMPAGLGMHPYFPRHGRAVLTADVAAVWLTDETCLPTERVPCPAHWQLGAGAPVDALRCDNQFEPWDGRARISWPDRRMAMQVTASADLNRLVVYAPEGEDFFCVEPVSHVTDAFNLSADGMPQAESGMRVLAPGEIWRVWMELSPSAS